MEDLDRKKRRYNQEKNKPVSEKRMSVWMLIITDILLTVICLGAFTLYHYVLPRHMASKEIVVASVDNGEEATFVLPETTTSNTTDTSDTILTASNTLDQTKFNPKVALKSGDQTQNLGSYTNYGNSDTIEISGNTSERDYIKNSKKTMTKINSYSSNNIQFTTNKVEIGNGIDKITYYLSDIYVTNVKYLKTAFASGEYGKNLREANLKVATHNKALLAINGDFYGNSEVGVVIRNGVLYRSVVYDADICVLFLDGTMKTYSPEDFNAEKVITEGAWQAWIFGPQLLDKDGNILSTFNSTAYLSNKHPRTSIGYVEPGHYVFAVVDGRNIGYSRGVTLTELGQIMIDAGCVKAYNLDGGKSSSMVYEDEYVNQPADGGRTISDIIYIGE